MKRSLKKSLALALVLALVLSLGIVGTVGASANNLDDFTDASQVGAAYTEATDLFIGLGIVNGTTATTLEPQGNYTREQAAKVLAYMMLGSSVADKLSADSAPFTDVAADRWSAGYIAYCVNEGVIAGYGDGTFGPEDKLTGYQWAKMLLVAIGYGTSEDYTGTGWAISVAKDAFAADIFKGDTAAASNSAITREQAILLGFNGLLYGDETTDTETQYILGVVNPAAAAELKNLSGNLYESIADGKDAVAALVGDYVYGIDYTLTSVDVEVTTSADSLADDVFNCKTVNTEDNFGRDVTKYVVKSKTISKATVTPDLTYTASVKSGTIYTDLGLDSAITATSITDGVASAALPVKKGDTTDKIGGNGALVEVFYNSDKDSINIVVINTYVGTVSKVTAATASADRSVSIAVGTHDVLAGFAGGTYETEDFAKNDVVLYTVANNGGIYTVESVALAEKLGLVATSISTAAGGSFVADGTTYKYSAKSDSELATSYDFETEFDAYLDSYGYVIYIDNAATASNYAFVKDLGTGSGDLGATEYKAKLVFSDGTTSIVTTTADYRSFDHDSNAGTANISAKGYAVSYTKNSDDEYTLSVANSTAISATALSLKSGNAAFTWGSSYVANAKTVFVIAKTSGSKTTYTTYTGIANVPSMSGTVSGSVITSSGVAKLVFVDNPTVSSSTTSVPVFLSGKYDTVTIDGDTYYTTKAVIDGTPTAVNTTVNTYKGIYDSYSVDDDGYYSFGTPIFKEIYGIKAESNGIVGFAIADTGAINYYGYTDDCIVYSYKDNTYSESSIAALNDVTSASTVLGYFSVNDDGMIDSIYIYDATL